MRKVIAAINMSLDGFCDHTAMTADEEVHQYFADVVRSAGVLLYGRITYQLMESYWPNVVKQPTGEKATDDFANAIDQVPKIVFSHTLKTVEWKTAKVAQKGLKEEVSELKKQSGKDIFIGSPGLIVALTDLQLIDEYHLCVHPVLVGKGLPLFKNIADKVDLRLLNTKTLKGGHVIIDYGRAQ